MAVVVKVVVVAINSDYAKKGIGKKLSVNKEGAAVVKGDFRPLRLYGTGGL